MFSLFKRQKANINSVIIEDFGWTKVKNNASIIQWINPEQTIAVSVNFFDLPPDIPTIRNIGILRTFYRNSVASGNGGLVILDLIKLKGFTTVKSIFKLPQDPSGMTYIASLTIPFEKYSFVLKVQCAEFGATGMRDAFIANRLIVTGEISISDHGFGGWFADPYDKDFKGGTLMNKSEEEIYDAEFPNHPLTSARKLIARISNGIEFKPEIKKLQPFAK